MLGAPLTANVSSTISWILRTPSASHHVKHQLEEPGPEGNNPTPGACAGVVEQVLDEGRDPGAAVTGERGEAGGREELDGEKPAQAAPVAPVGGPHDGGPPVNDP